MKALITTLSLVLGLAGAARADHIGIYSDQFGGRCYIQNLVQPPGINTVYILHMLNVGSTASEFRVVDTSGLFATTQIFPPGFVTDGTWNTNLKIAYGGCVIGNHVIATLNFLWFGNPPTCNQSLWVGPAPLSPIPGDVAVVDCTQPNGQVESASGGTLHLLPLCGNQHCDGRVAVEQSTWGSVKALYR